MGEKITYMEILISDPLIKKSASQDYSTFFSAAAVFLTWKNDWVFFLTITLEKEKLIISTFGYFFFPFLYDNWLSQPKS